jgi:hypothetical protein
MLSLVQVDVALESCSWLDRDKVALSSFYSIQTSHPWTWLAPLEMRASHFSVLMIHVLLLQSILGCSIAFASGSFHSEVIFISTAITRSLFSEACNWTSIQFRNDLSILGLGSSVHVSLFDFVLHSIIDCAFAFNSLPLVIRFRPSSMQYCWALLALLARSKGKRPANHC